MQKKSHFTRKQLLDRYGIGNTTLYRWLEAGQFPKPIRYGPRCIRWKREDLEAWEAKQA